MIEAKYCNDIELVNILQPMMDKLTNLQNNVIAQIKWNGNIIKFDNLIKFEDESVIKAVDDLINKIGHNQDANQGLYHAEKKAVAFVLNQNEQEMDILIETNLRMCRDCHRFFLKLSQYYPSKLIVVVDPRRTHNFSNAKCSCGVY